MAAQDVNDQVIFNHEIIIDNVTGEMIQDNGWTTLKNYLRLKELAQVSEKSFNKIERELNYPRNALHNYKEGREPSGTRLIELAHYFGVTPEYLLGCQGPSKNVGFGSLKM